MPLPLEFDGLAPGCAAASCATAEELLRAGGGGGGGPARGLLERVAATAASAAAALPPAVRPDIARPPLPLLLLELLAAAWPLWGWCPAATAGAAPACVPLAAWGPTWP